MRTSATRPWQFTRTPCHSVSVAVVCRCFCCIVCFCFRVHRQYTFLLLLVFYCASVVTHLATPHTEKLCIMHRTISVGQLSHYSEETVGWMVDLEFAWLQGPKTFSSPSCRYQLWGLSASCVIVLVILSPGVKVAVEHCLVLCLWMSGAMRVLSLYVLCHGHGQFYLYLYYYPYIHN